MAYEQRDNSGALFKNAKDGNESRPDYTGNAMVNGAMVRMAAWIKDGKNGKFMSIKFDEPREQQGGGGETPAPNTRGGPGADLDDEIPFVTPWGLR